MHRSRFHSQQLRHQPFDACHRNRMELFDACANHWCHGRSSLLDAITRAADAGCDICICIASSVEHV